MPTFRFAIISDPHVALPHTIEPLAQRFHLVEVSVAALNQALAHLEQLDLDFLLIPGDLTQDGEPDNHTWLSERLARLPFPAYVIPGNHDVPVPQATCQAVGLDTFADYYGHCGYGQARALYYRQALLPGVQLIGLNSNGFADSGQQLGCLDQAQLQWLRHQLQECTGDCVLVMIHHNVIEHLPGQSTHNLGCRYMLDNAPALLQILAQYNVKLILTGHLHVQDIAHQDGIYEITTGSLVSYPHPYRVIEANLTPAALQLAVTSYRIDAVEGYADLAHRSRQFLADRSPPFMRRLLTSPPLNLSPAAAEPLLASLHYFWADVAAGDGEFDFPHFPATVRAFLAGFSDFNRPLHATGVDNNTVLKL